MTNGVPRGLSGVAMPDLEAVLEAIERGQLAAPVTKAGLAAAGLGAQSTEVAAVLDGLPREAAMAVVRVAMAERVHRAPPRLELVWTGPEARTSEARDTAVVLRQLFAQARKRVLLGGYSFDHAKEIFAPLHAAMRDHGVSATFFLDIEQPQPGAPLTGDAYAAVCLREFVQDNWPFGDPVPDIYYDPRTTVPGKKGGEGWASLHAKCLVVDGEHALVTSANFTARGQTRNIEAGVLIEDPDFAQRLEAHFRALISAGHVRRYAR